VIGEPGQLPGLEISLAFEDKVWRKQVNKLRSEHKARKAFKVLSWTKLLRIECIYSRHLR
jgi:hypothetical protein